MKKPGKPVTRSKAVVEKIVPKVTVSEIQEAEKTINRCVCSTNISMRSFKFSVTYKLEEEA